MVASVQHTGSHLIAKMFPSWIGFKDPYVEGSHYFGHISEGQLPHILRLAEDFTLLVPIRHPFRVAESWIRRGKDLSTLINHYSLLINEIDKLDPYYIAIDTGQKKQPVS